MNSANSGNGERMVLTMVTVTSRRGLLQTAANLIECRLWDSFQGAVLLQTATHVKKESDMDMVRKLCSGVSTIISQFFMIQVPFTIHLYLLGGVGTDRPTKLEKIGVMFPGMSRCNFAPFTNGPGVIVGQNQDAPKVSVNAWEWAALISPHL